MNSSEATPNQNGYPDPNLSLSPAQAQLLHVTTSLSLSPTASNKGVNVVAYKECLKNHAAALGGSATDGCGEFMPATAEGGSPDDTLHCSACGCHRNFHRKEVEGSGGASPLSYLPKCPYWISGGNSTTTPSTTPSHYEDDQVLQQCHQSKGALQTRRGPQPLEGMQAGVGMGPTTPSEIGGKGGGRRDMGPPAETGGRQRVELGVTNKKRHRTKFTKEQKEKLLEFAEKAGWKIQKLDEGLVQNFCKEVGIKRRVLKVWMHNNKQHFVKTQINSPPNLNDGNSNSNSNSNCSYSELAS